MKIHVNFGVLHTRRSLNRIFAGDAVAGQALILMRENPKNPKAIINCIFKSDIKPLTSSHCLKFLFNHV